MLTSNDSTCDAFDQHPFKTYTEGAAYEVKFADNDGSLFYKLEEEVAYGDDVATGTTTGIEVKAWFLTRRDARQWTAHTMFDTCNTCRFTCAYGPYDVNPLAQAHMPYPTSALG